MLKGFFKPNIFKIILFLLLLPITLFLGLLFFSSGLTTILLIVFTVLGFPLLLIKFAFRYGLFFALVGLILEFIWLYLVSCGIFKAGIFINNKLKVIKWDAKRLALLGALLVILLLTFGFLNSGWGDIFTPTADDSKATQEGIKRVSKANNQFAIDLYSKLSNDSENLFFSPWSISTALAMTYEGARGETASEIEDVFYFPEDNKTRRYSYAAILNNINKGWGNYELSTANAIWLQKDYPFEDDYKDTINRFYLGEVSNLDFVKDPKGSSSEINNWVSRNTNNKIKEIVTPDSFNEYTRALLTNAIHFKGKWKNQFDKEDTEKEAFTLPSGKQVQVPMMQLTDDDIDFGYAVSDGVQILEMPYKGEDISMLVLLPIKTKKRRTGGEKTKTSSISSLESMLREGKLQEWRNKLNSQPVYVHFPKFNFKTDYSLADHFKSMGMQRPFTRDADFSGMDGTRQLFISDLKHKAFIDVYEEGTEAVAATSVQVGSTTSAKMPPVFRADHPFIFIIQQKDTGNILFMGRVNDPR